MKTNTNHICQFSHVYVVRVVAHEDVILGFGSFWPVVKSSQRNKWLKNQWKSMDYIDKKQHVEGFFYVTNVVEPVILIHECLSFASVRSTLSHDWRAMDPIDFCKNYAYNMHKLQEEYLAISNRKRQAKIRLPCGPHFKCKKHDRMHCRRCMTQREVYNKKKWNVIWWCNTKHCSIYRILDEQNGLNMTLMQTVQCAQHHIY